MDFMHSPFGLELKGMSASGIRYRNSVHLAPSSSSVVSTLVAGQMILEQTFNHLPIYTLSEILRHRQLIWGNRERSSDQPEFGIDRLCSNTLDRPFRGARS
jgi:hypothetical protein